MMDLIEIEKVRILNNFLTLFHTYSISVTCMLFIYFVYLVSVDPDIGKIDVK